MTLDEIAEDKTLDCNEGPPEEKTKEEVKVQNSSSYNRNMGTIRSERTSRGFQFNLLLKKSRH